MWHTEIIRRQLYYLNNSVIFEVSQRVTICHDTMADPIYLPPPSSSWFSSSITTSVRPQSAHSLSPVPTEEPQAGHLPWLISSLEARSSGCISMKYSAMRSCALSRSSEDTINRHLGRQPLLQPASEVTVQGIPALMRILYSSPNHFGSPSLTTAAFSMAFAISRFFFSCASLCSSCKRRTAPQSAHFSICGIYSISQLGHILFRFIVRDRESKIYFPAHSTYYISKSRNKLEASGCYGSCERKDVKAKIEMQSHSYCHTTYHLMSFIPLFSMMIS
jgi:hypothetical protein